MANQLAAPGKVFMCLACLKCAGDKYGIDKPIHHGYDVSCMLNAVEVTIEEVNRCREGVYGLPPITRPQ